LLPLFCAANSPAATYLVKMRKIDVPPNLYYVFDPTNLTINLGDTVTWTNTVSNITHDSTHYPPDDPSWHSAPLLGSATFSVTFASAGDFPYFCSYHTLSHPEESGMITVVAPNKPPEISITDPTNNTSFFAPASLTLQADASDDGSIAQVEFFSGTTSLGVASTEPYTNSVTDLPAGTHSFTAIATDNQGASSTSGVVTVNVVAPPAIRNAVQYFPDGAFHFRIFGGNAGETCVIDACETLPNWSPVITNIFPNTDCAFCPFIDYTETATNVSRRFYRSRVFP